MIKLRTLLGTSEKLKNANLDIDLLKDVFYELFLFDTEYPKAYNKEIVILNYDENIQILLSLPAYREIINDYEKLFYVRKRPKFTKIVYKQLNNTN